MGAAILPSWFAPAAFALAGLAVLLGGGLLVWGLWADSLRGRRRRRCQRCWHDLSGTPGLVCPECGSRAPREADLHRVRRRWRAVVLGSLLLVAGVAVWGGALPRAALRRALPDAWLVTLLPWSSPAPGGDSVHEELRRRLAWGEVSPAAIDALVERLLRGESSAPPGSDAWVEKYALLIPPLARHLPLGSEPSQRLLGLPPRIDLAIASPWPIDLPPFATLEVQPWWGPVQLEIEIDCPRQPMLPPLRIGFDSRGGGSSPLPIEFPLPLGFADTDPLGGAFAFGGALPTLEHPLRGEALPLRVRIAWRPIPIDAATPPPWQRHPDRTADRIIQPDPPRAVRLPRTAPEDELARRRAAAIAEVFSLGFHPPRDDRPSGLRFDTLRTATPDFEGVAIGVEVELLEEGVPRRRSWIWWPGGVRIPALSGARGMAQWRPSVEDAEALRSISNDGRWTLRIRGHPELAMRAVAAVAAVRPDLASELRTCWEGEVEIALPLLRTPAPSRHRLWHPLDP